MSTALAISGAGEGKLGHNGLRTTSHLKNPERSSEPSMRHRSCLVTGWMAVSIGNPAYAQLESLVTDVHEITSAGSTGGVYGASPDWIPIVGGDDDTSFPAVCVLARNYGQGRVLLIGHDGLLINPQMLDNARFIRNVMAWLRGSGSNIVQLSSGHSEWISPAAFSQTAGMLQQHGFAVAQAGYPLSASTLSQGSTLILGNAWGVISPGEVEALRSWVAAGGGLCLVGLGWSWDAYHPGTTLEEYPMMQAANPYGGRWLRNGIHDPTNQQAGSVVFHTFYPGVEPVDLVAAMDYIDAAHGTHGNAIGTTIAADANLRRRFVHSHATLGLVSREWPVGHGDRQVLGSYCAALVSREPSWYARPGQIDSAVLPTSAWVRERLWRTWVEAVPLTPPVHALIATTGGLSGDRLQLWNDHDLILLDNTSLAPPQLELIARLYEETPLGLRLPSAISVRDFLGNSPTAVDLTGTTPMVNVFGVPVGAVAENSFPSDVPPGLIDLFSVVVAHEANHVVDALSIGADPQLRQRRDQLIADAGAEPMNYLRSMLPEGFFLGNPQEFVASIANQWFANSERTIELGLVRFDAGRTDPINQALFMADVYATGPDTVASYRINGAGEVLADSIPVVRGPSGWIDRMVLGSRRIRFTFSPAGRVTSYGSTCFANCDFSSTAPVLNVADFTCFLQQFAAGHPEANCDQSSAPPVLNVADFTCFLQRFASGCP